MLTFILVNLHIKLYKDIFVIAVRLPLRTGTAPEDAP